MSTRRLRAAPCGLALLFIVISLLILISDARAHCFVGNRFFPATLNVDDPCVADEMSLPTVDTFKTADDPPLRQTDVGVDFSKRITENFGITVASNWTNLRQPDGRDISGFQNLNTSFQFQLWKDPARELALMAGLKVEWGGTGASGVGASPFSTITPTFFFGKGLGELPDTIGWARPFAVTGQIGYAIPTSSSTLSVDPGTGNLLIAPNPQFLVYGATLQYSMPYLKSAVIDLQLPDFINHLIPIVEAQLQTPAGNSFGTGLVTTGTVNPGVIWVGNYYQVGVEAIIPINRQSGTGVGVIGQLHLYLDDIFPRGIGQPLFGAPTPVRPLFGG
jgi:hypothetical protein